MNGLTVLEEDLTGEMLEVRVLHPAGEHRLVGEVEGVLQVQQSGDQARMGGGPPLTSRKETGPLPLEPGPVDQRGQLDQLMPTIDHVDQARP